MSSHTLLAQARQHLVVGASLFGLIVNLGAPVPAAAQNAVKKPTTATPIQHVIVIVGENRSFDHLFATYQPPSGQTVDNLLSKGIVNVDGTPGPNFSLAAQNEAWVQGTFQIAPTQKKLYAKLPPTNTQG